MAGLFDGTPLERPVTCERCGKPVAECPCPRDARGAVREPRDQHPRVRREKRRGKFVTVIAELDPHATDLKAMAQALRKAHGVGGTVTKANEIELQGDLRDKVVEHLNAQGYKAKPAGG